MSILDAIDEYKNGSPRLTFLELQEKLNLMIDNPRTKFNQTQHQSAGTKETLVDFFELFIRDCENGVRLSPTRKLIKPQSMLTYYTSMSYLKKFQAKKDHEFVLTDFNQRDIDAFSDFLIIDHELAMNTHAKIMMDLLQIIK